MTPSVLRPTFDRRNLIKGAAALGALQVASRPHLILIAVGTAVLASVVPYTLELAAMRRAPRRVFGILLSLEPGVATLAGWVLLGQRTPPAAIAAIALVVLASAGAAMSAKLLAELDAQGDAEGLVA